MSSYHEPKVGQIWIFNGHWPMRVDSITGDQVFMTEIDTQQLTFPTEPRSIARTISNTLCADDWTLDLEYEVRRQYNQDLKCLLGE